MKNNYRVRTNYPLIFCRNEPPFVHANCASQRPFALTMGPPNLVAFINPPEGGRNESNRRACMPCRLALRVKNTRQRNTNLRLRCVDANNPLSHAVPHSWWWWPRPPWGWPPPHGRDSAYSGAPRAYCCCSVTRSFKPLRSATGARTWVSEATPPACSQAVSSSKSTNKGLKKCRT